MQSTSKMCGRVQRACAGPEKGALSVMNTTIMNYAIGALVVAGGFFVGLAVLVW